MTHLLEFVESYRELLSGLLDVYLSSVSNRMNEVMRVLTVIATLFIPLTFIAGLYGMNFDGNASPWNMPELRWYWGYPLLLLLLVLVTVGEVVFFWRKGWIFAEYRRGKKEDFDRFGTFFRRLVFLEHRRREVAALGILGYNSREKVRTHYQAARLHSDLARRQIQRIGRP